MCRKSVSNSKSKALTWRTARLCMSPAHAGIMVFSTRNSSLILLRRLLSIKLCAVLRVILRSASLAALCCFLTPFASRATPAPLPGAFAANMTAPLPDPLMLPLLFSMDASAASSCCWGFIWIILQERVGGGGSPNKMLSLFSMVVGAEDRLSCLHGIGEQREGAHAVL